MSWGKSIIVVFVLFAAFIGTLVAVCVRQDISLVSKEYYKDELNYGDQMQRLENANNLATKPVISVVDRFLVINYNDLQTGELKLFRPSDEKLDRQFKLATGPTQVFDLHDMPAGMYKVRMKWSLGDKEYFIEELVTL